MNDNLESWKKANEDEQTITVRLMKQLEEMNEELETILRETEREAALSDSHTYQKQTLLIKMRVLKNTYAGLAERSDSLMKQLEAFVRKDDDAKRSLLSPTSP